MPGNVIPGSSRKAVAMADAWIYDLWIHHDDIVTPLLRQWDVEELDGLDADGESARRTRGGGGCPGQRGLALRRTPREAADKKAARQSS